MEFKQKKVTVEGVEYTLQKLPVRQALKLRDSWLENGEVNQEKMYDALLNNIVVNPKVKLDDFDELKTVEAIGIECLNFVWGNSQKKLKKEVEYYYESFYKPALLLINDGILTWTEANSMEEDEMYMLILACEKLADERKTRGGE